MKIRESELKRIVKEELEGLLQELNPFPFKIW